MTDKPLFSILVPCCDVAPYVGECIDSLKVQTVPFEAILVIEESKDETEPVIRAAVAGDARFRVITEPRSGSPSTPRNTGLGVATGDYVIFLDGDDTLTPTALADLAERIRRHPGTDLFPCAVREAELLHDNYPADLQDRVLTGPEATLTVARQNAEPMAMAQMTVCRRAFLDAHSLRFVDGLRHEDEEFTPRALYLAASVVPTHLPFYLYRRRENSITTASATRSLQAIATVYRNLFRFHDEVRPTAEISRAWARNWLNTFNAAFFYERAGLTRDPAAVLSALRDCLGDALPAFARLARHASVPKRIGAALTRLAVRTGWLGPVRAFFRRYYKLLGYKTA